MHPGIKHYIDKQNSVDVAICSKLYEQITEHMPEAENKIWHSHPVWFLAGNPIVGFGKQKKGIRLMFWSGASFDEPGLDNLGKTFKDASVFFNDPTEIELKDLKRWIEKSKVIQWDYKNVVKRKGKLVKLHDNASH